MRKCLSCPPDACGCPLTLLTLTLTWSSFFLAFMPQDTKPFLFSLLPAVQTFHISSSAPCTLPSPGCLHTQLTSVPPHEHGMLYGTNICQAPPPPHVLLFFVFLSNQYFSSLMENFQCHQNFAASFRLSLGFPALEAALTLSWRKAHCPAHQKSLLASSLLNEHITVMASFCHLQWHCAVLMLDSLMAC